MKSKTNEFTPQLFSYFNQACSPCRGNCLEFFTLPDEKSKQISPIKNIPGFPDKSKFFAKPAPALLEF
jgi:hypothetical protein